MSSQAGGTDTRLRTRSFIVDFTLIGSIPDEKPASEFKVSAKDGTEAFLAPEVKSQAQFHPQPLDVWALGVTIFAVVFGKLPFHKNQFQLEFPDKVNISEECKALLRALLTEDPSTRPTIQDAIEQFKWLQVQDGFEIEYPPKN